ncbi:MAG TPA: F0F1 ATP synthase subunit gamma, partial [Planctomycetota bacterium]|nr:F0F1 ATP synthase subunit gamma [Planctomycetota bacterium]
MAKLLELRQRIKAVENIRTITRTLATVAAAKLSRTRRRAAGLRTYAASVRAVLLGQRLQLAGARDGAGAAGALLRERARVER